MIMEDHKAIQQRQQQAAEQVSRLVGMNIHAATFKTAFKATKAHLLSSTSMTRA